MKNFFKGKKIFKSKKSIWIAAILAVIVAAAIIISSMKGSGSDVGVSTTSIKLGDITSDVILSGTIKSGDEVEINSELEAEVKEVLSREGERVEKGQVIARLETDVLQTRLESALVDLRIQRRELEDSIDGTAVFRLEKDAQNKKIQSEIAQRDYENAMKLYQSGALSEDELSERERESVAAISAYEVASREYSDEKVGKNIQTKRDRVRLAEIEVELARKQLEDAFIKSPIDGTIVYSNCKVGIDARDQKPMFVIHDLGNLQVHANISQFDIYRVKEGQSVQITGDAFPGRILSGVVSYIAPSAMEDKNGSGKGILVKADIMDPPPEIKTGFTADIEIQTQKAQGVMVLPYECIVRDSGGGNFVFKLEEGSLDKVEVELGVEGDLAAQVISGELKEGDAIVTNPGDDFHDGMKVSAQVSDDD